MYLSQTLNVNLTEENAAILKRPSKIFNKIRAVLSGSMTPTQVKQADVMLSVVQRLNVAFRKSGFSNLIAISVNGQCLYDAAHSESNNLEQSNTSLIEGLEGGNISKMNSLSITVDGEDDILRYLIHVNIVRRPKKDRTPVQVTVFGFLKAFKRQSLENDDAFSIRIKAVLSKQWGDNLSSKLAQIEADFTAAVGKIQQQINLLFPEKSSLEENKNMKRKSALLFKNKAVQSRYDDSVSYLPVWYLHFEDCDEQHLDGIAFEEDQSGEWVLDSPEFDGTDKSSWTDAISLGDAASIDSGSSCSGGASCGGGCGGS